MTALAKILKEKGFNKRFRPEKHLLEKFECEGCPRMTVYRFTKLVNGNSKLYFNEAVKIANWLDIDINKLKEGDDEE